MIILFIDNFSDFIRLILLNKINLLSFPRQY